MSSSSEQIAREFAQRVREKVSEQPREIYLFGSRARGDEDPDSDYDVLIVVESKSRELEDHVFEVAAELLDRYDALVVPMICTAEKFDYFKEVGLYREVVREGVQL